MTRLMQEILADQNATFEIEADLPTGNRMVGTVGPIIGSKLCSQVTFTKNPASEEDIKIAREVLQRAIGATEEVFRISNTREEHNQAAKAIRRFLGGAGE